MIKLFRIARLRMINQVKPGKIRKSLLSEGDSRSPGKAWRYIKYAIGEIVLVVIGILIALQINNWNETRKERIEEREILADLQSDIRADIENVSYQFGFKTKMVKNYKNCLNILTDKKDADKTEFMESYKSILQVGYVSLNTTTFTNLQTTGDIRLIKSKALADSIVNYYNTDLGAWQSALQDYTRNITAPYVLNFDYLPQNTHKESQDNVIIMPGKPKDFKKPEKTLEDYKEDFFIINTLRQKTWNIEALLLKYQDLLDYANNLDKSIQKQLDNR
jgi:hypothetical protein